MFMRAEDVTSGLLEIPSQNPELVQEDREIPSQNPGLTKVRAKVPSTSSCRPMGLDEVLGSRTT